MDLYTDRSTSPYPGPAQIRLYIDGYWIDDACAVQWQVQDTKIPKWGYNDRLFRAVALGTTLVQGMLSIQFRYVGYLNGVVAKLAKNRAQAEELIERVSAKEPVGGLPARFMLSSKEEIEAFAVEAAKGPDQGTAVFEFLKNRFWKSTPGAWGDEGQVIKNQLGRAGTLPPFDIQVRYNPNSEDPALQQKILGVHLIGESKVVEIDHPDGSRPIREVYSFFAKDLTPRTQSGGAVAGS